LWGREMSISAILGPFEVTLTVLVARLRFARSEHRVSSVSSANKSPGTLSGTEAIYWLRE